MPLPPRARLDTYKVRVQISSAHPCGVVVAHDLRVRAAACGCSRAPNADGVCGVDTVTASMPMAEAAVAHAIALMTYDVVARVAGSLQLMEHLESVHVRP